MLAILQRCAGSSCQSTRLVRPEMLDRLCHTTVGELTSLSAINVETRNHAESQNQRLVKAAAAGDTDDSDRRKHSKLCEPLMAAWDSSHYVTYTYRKNSHVYMLSQKICTHITPYGASAKHFTTLSAIDPHFAAPQLLVQNLALPEVAGVALPAKD